MKKIIMALACLLFITSSGLKGSWFSWEDIKPSIKTYWELAIRLASQAIVGNPKRKQLEAELIAYDLAEEDTDFFKPIADIQMLENTIWTQALIQVALASPQLQSIQLKNRQKTLIIDSTQKPRLVITLLLNGNIDAAASWDGAHWQFTGTTPQHKLPLLLTESDQS